MLGALVLGAAWLLPSDSYLLLPDRAKPLEPLVKVQGEKDTGPGGIYYVDVIVRKATCSRSSSPACDPTEPTSCPSEALVPPGSNFAERRRQNLRQMDRSEEVAAAVALRELGYDVDAKPEGALVVAVAQDAPAAGKLEPTEVIVAVDGSPVRTPDDLRRLIAKHKPGDTVRLRVRAGGATRSRRGRHDREPGRSRAVRSSGSRSSSSPTSSSRSASTSTSAASAGLRPGSPSPSTSSRSCAATSTAASASPRRASSSSTAAIAPIGGIKQKVIGARRSRADVFLVPAGDNAVEARRHAGDLRIIPVESFGQALRALATLPRKG